MSEYDASTSILDTVEAAPQLNKRPISASSAASETPSPFLELPAELRFLVYSFLSPFSSSDPKEFGRLQHSRLVQTCRQI
jgi:hypothetical protein